MRPFTDTEVKTLLMSITERLLSRTSESCTAPLKCSILDLVRERTPDCGQTLEYLSQRLTSHEKPSSTPTTTTPSSGRSVEVLTISPESSHIKL